MFYLILAIICSATIAFIFKYAQRYNTNQYLVTSSNYFTAFLISLGMIINKEIFREVIKEQSFWGELKTVLWGDHYILSPYGSVIWGIIVGGISGAFFFLSFTYYQKSVKENGIGLSGTFSKLGILIPMIFSIIIWREFPTTTQWIGIVLSLVSIVIVNLSLKSVKKLDINITIILLFIFGGMAEFSNKIYQKYALSEYKDIFLFSIFLVAFPIFSAGGILLINIGGFVMFKEKVSNKNKLAIGLTIVALILINL